MMSKTQTLPTPPSTAPEAMASFALDAEPVLGLVQAAVARFVAASPTPIARATDLQRLLEVDSALGWQVFKLSQAETPFAGAPFIPGPGPMAKVLQSAREHGFGESAVAAVESAYASFLAFVECHADDRGAFDAMIAGLGGDAAEQVDLKDRRAHFRASARLWGFQAKVSYRCHIRHPIAMEKHEDALTVCGVMNLRQFRPVPPLTLMRRSRIQYTHESAPTGKVFEPAAHDFSLLDDFCTHPVPKIEVVWNGDMGIDTLRLDGVGKSGGVDCFAYDALRNFPVEEKEWGWGIRSHGYTPSELLIVDMLVPEGWADLSTLSAKVYGNASNVLQPHPHVMPFKETAEHLGTNLEALIDPAIPRCPEMIRHLLRHYGWNRTGFDVFRCKVRYPLMHTMLNVTVHAKKGDGGTAEQNTSIR